MKAAGRKPSVSSLNPSASRFTLRLPLLGRPKVPLEQAVASAQAEDIRQVASGGPAKTDDAAAADGKSLNFMHLFLYGKMRSREGEAAKAADDSKSATTVRPASWWDYVGWGDQASSDSSDAQGQGQDKRSDDSKDVVENPETKDRVDIQAAQPARQPSSSDATTKPQNLTPESQDEASSLATATQHDHQDAKSDKKPSSILSTETAKSHGPLWYSPWAWYPSGHPPSAVAAQPSAEGSDTAKTDAEMPTNPIQSSIADNRSGWMSFFMAVTDGTDSRRVEGMEVAVEVPIGDNKANATNIQAQATPKKSELVLSTSPKTPSLAPSTPIPKSPKTPKAPAKDKERESKKPEPAPPLTDSDSVKRGVRTPSPTPSGATGTPPSSATPNFVLPTWEDTFHILPRSQPPPRPHGTKSKLTGALSYVAGALFSGESGLVKGKGKGKGKAKGKDGDGYRTRASPAPTQQEQGELVAFGQELPKALDVVGETLNPYILNGGCRVVVIGVAGWSPGAVTRTLAGGLPSSSSKFVNMTVQALEQYADEGGFKFKKVTPMALEGDGTIRKKVSRVYNHLLENDEWMEDLHAADVIFVASHSQGAVVSTHLIDRLIEDGHILTARSVDTLAKSAAAFAAGGAAAVPTAQAQRICLLSLCGIHLGPLRYMKTSSLLQPYIQYVENAAARELFEFQDTESKVSKNYVGALRNVLDHGTKAVYIASLNDQVVPIYSGLFTAASHPRILRALYIDNDAYHSSDFLSNLLILLIRILNAGLSDRGLLAHLSEATAGTLSGIGHSTAYEELATYSLAVKYFFTTNDGTASDAELVINPFNAVEEQNDYEIPWLLRDMIADHKISHFFAHEFSQLRDAFDGWQPKTTILRDVKRKLQPITRLSTTAPQTSSSISKL
ncbi:hypothetical protein LXA43DRAFT_975425 [Ganoderma leucocontextum]|nr:hypothetical protein LXA43DRAFT_975425 [Ganoderma leucocontextum]